MTVRYIRKAMVALMAACILVIGWGLWGILQ